MRMNGGLLCGKVLLWVAAACFAPAAAFSTNCRKVIDAAPPMPQPRVCTEKEERCLHEGRLPFAVDGRCYEPLSQGPCAEDDFWFALDSASSGSSPHVTGACLRRPCPLGEVPHQGRCLNAEEARREVCEGRRMYLDPMGKLHCGPLPSWKNFVKMYIICNAQRTLLKLYVICTPRNSSTNRVHATSTFVTGNAKCATNDDGECMREVVIHSSPEAIEIETED